MRQWQGKVMEKEILATVYGTVPDVCDTAVHDLNKSNNNLNPGYNVSIKTTKSKTVNCSSIFNIMKTIENKSPLHLVVITYIDKDGGKTKIVKRVSRYDLSSLGPEAFGATKENWEEFKEDITTLQKAVTQKCDTVDKKKQRREITELKRKIISKYPNPIYTINHKAPGENRPGRVQASLSGRAMKELESLGLKIESNEGSILQKIPFASTYTNTYKKNVGTGVRKRKTRKTRKNKKLNKNVIFLNKKGLSKDTIEKVNLTLQYL
jgi:hypothetical protein